MGGGKRCAGRVSGQSSCEWKTTGWSRVEGHIQHHLALYCHIISIPSHTPARCLLLYVDRVTSVKCEQPSFVALSGGRLADTRPKVRAPCTRYTDVSRRSQLGLSRISSTWFVRTQEREREGGD